MWYVIRTELCQEEETRLLLLRQDGVNDVYLPLYRRTVTGEDGRKRNRFVPTITGILFANIDETKLDLLISSWGYIRYRQDVRNLATGEVEPKYFTSRAHLLFSRSDITDMPRTEIIDRARVPERDIERLRLFNGRQAEGIEDLKILDVSYQVLAAENDTVLITEGPYLGIEGVVKRVTERGKKDRRLHFSIGNFTVSVPKAPNYRYVVIREARRGAAAQEVNSWRHIDSLTGRIQALFPGANAAAMLRDTLRALNRDVRLDTLIATLEQQKSGGRIIDRERAADMHRLLTSLTAEEAGHLISLSRYFQTADRSIDRGLGDLIPDTRLRPMLTPTPGAGIPEGGDHTVISRDGFNELILRTDLRRHFTDGMRSVLAATLSALGGAIDDDYTYYAHVALIPGGGTTTAVVSWGDFIRQYLLLTDREAFLRDLQAKGYTRLHELLTACATPGSGVSLYDTGGITGFATAVTATDGDGGSALAAARALVARCAPAAVEMWQGAKLLYWRKLAQRHVILHKVRLEE